MVEPSVNQGVIGEGQGPAEQVTSELTKAVFPPRLMVSTNQYPQFELESKIDKPDLIEAKRREVGSQFSHLGKALVSSVEVDSRLRVQRGILFNYRGAYYSAAALIGVVILGRAIEYGAGLLGAAIPLVVVQGIFAGSFNRIFKLKEHKSKARELKQDSKEKYGAVEDEVNRLLKLVKSAQPLPPPGREIALSLDLALEIGSPSVSYLHRCDRKHIYNIIICCVSTLDAFNSIWPWRRPVGEEAKLGEKFLREVGNFVSLVGEQMEDPEGVKEQEAVESFFRLLELSKEIIPGDVEII